MKNGGIAEHLAAALAETGFAGSYRIHAIGEQFVPCATVKESLHDLGLYRDGMIKAVTK